MTIDLNRVDDWHLHLTVEPRSKDTLAGYALTCDRVKCKPTVIENLMGDDGSDRSNRTELIPTIDLRGELGQAIILLHDVAKVFAISGWGVRRMKIEGRVRPSGSEGLYAETHIELGETEPFDWPVSRSLTSGKYYGTIRTRDVSDVALQIGRENAIKRGYADAKWGYAVYDSNRAMDRSWFGSWGRMG